MLKIIGKLFSKALWGSVGGFIKQYAQIIVAILLFAFGVHYATLRSNHKSLKKDYEELTVTNKTLLSEKAQLQGEVIILKDQFKADSLEFQKLVIEFQTLIQQLQTRNKASEAKAKERGDYAKELESGLLCKTVKVGLFGKKTVTIGKCEDENE